MRRREFIAFVGSAAAAWPLMARAQQPAMPVIGFLRSSTLADATNLTAAFRQGLQETGYVEGQNVATEYRFAENDRDKLTALVSEFTRRPVAVIVGNLVAALAAKVEVAARAIGQQLIVLSATNASEIQAAFATFAQRGAGALIITSSAFTFSHREEIIALAARYGLPASYGVRENATAGGLISYGASITDAYRQVGVYAGRILRGEKPGDLPVIQSTKFEFVINLKTAKRLGLTVPLIMQMTADQVIE
jgi:hypothetical protein